MLKLNCSSKEGETMNNFSEAKKTYLRGYLHSKSLSKSEIEVVILVLQGLINREVANRLCVAEKTVKFHLTNVYKKLKISRRSEIVWTLPLHEFIGIDEGPKVAVTAQAPAEASQSSASEEFTLPIGNNHLEIK